MMNPLASPWIPLMPLAGMIWAARLQRKDWLAPSVFAPLLWFFYILLPLCLAPEFPVSAIGVWVVVLLIAAMVLGATLAEQAGATDGAAKPAPALLTTGFVLHLMVFLSALSLLGSVYAAVTTLKDYGLDFSVSGLFLIGHFLSVERYSGVQTPFLVRILVTWVFPAALLGGLSYVSARSRRERLLCFSPLLPAFVFSLVQASKAGTLVAAVLGVSGYLATRRRTAHGVTSGWSIRRRTILATSVVLFLGLSFFTAIDVLRSRKQNDETVRVTTDWDRVRSTAVGYLAGFSYWVDRDNGTTLSLGEYTFGGLLEVTGLRVRQTGIYTEMISLGAGGDDSNIYTAFRGLIEDFSLPGAVIFCILAGCLAGHAYKNCVSLQARYVLVLAAFYSFVIWSPIGSVFVYNGPILAMLVAVVALRKGASRPARQVLVA